MEMRISLYNSETYVCDLDYTLKSTPILELLRGKTIFITGATGLICSALIDLILRYNEKNGNSITVLAGGRNEQKMKDRFSRYIDSDCLRFITYDASRKNELNFYCDYIIHGASNAFPSVIQAHPIETMIQNFSGLHELLGYAEMYNVVNTVFISSSEVYGVKNDSEPFAENEYGFIDILNPRSSYSMGKRAAETLCASYSYEKKVAVSIVRPGHIYGPTASRNDNRVSSAFAYDAANGKDLVLKSDGLQIRSYCYTLDCATAILTVLVSGHSGVAFNISNPVSVITIREIAELFSKYGNVKLLFDFPTQSERVAFNPMVNSSLKSDKLQALGWSGLFDPREGVAHTIKILKEIKA